MARLAAVAVSSELWQIICTVGWSAGLNGTGIKCVEGLPEGAELVNSYYDWHRQTAMLVFRHESFTDLPIGAQYPELRVAHNTEHIR